MIQDTVEGLPVDQRMEPAAANEEFTGIVSRRDATRRESGWDPYEVWRTRVRAPYKAARAKKDRARDLLRR